MSNRRTVSKKLGNKEIARQLKEHCPFLVTIERAEECIDYYSEILAKSIVEGRKVYLSGIGTITVTKSKRKTISNLPGHEGFYPESSNFFRINIKMCRYQRKIYSHPAEMYDFWEKRSKNIRHYAAGQDHESGTLVHHSISSYMFKKAPFLSHVQALKVTTNISRVIAFYVARDAKTVMIKNVMQFAPHIRNYPHGKTYNLTAKSLTRLRLAIQDTYEPDG